MQPVRQWIETPDWPERDPEPEVTNRDPAPATAPAVPASVSALVKTGTAAGWDVRSGYSRALLRGVSTSTYRMVESFGVWFGPDHSSGWRVCAIYQRFADASEIRRFNGDSINVVSGTAAGKPGTWQWKTVTIFSGFNRHPVSVTQLKEFIAVRGSVLPAWFGAIRAEQVEKKAREKQAAKDRPKKAREAGN